MGEKDEKLLVALNEFSEMVNITPPSYTNDIGEWWERGLQEMSDYWLQDLREFGMFSRCNNKVLQKMHSMLLEQIEKRQLLNTLA